jgi:hypothetical protein
MAWESRRLPSRQHPLAWRGNPLWRPGPSPYSEFAHVGMDTRVCFHGLILISLALILSLAATWHLGGGLLASHRWRSDDCQPSSLSLRGRRENHQLFQSDAVHRVLRKACGLSFTGEKPNPRMKSLADFGLSLDGGYGRVSPGVTCKRQVTEFVSRLKNIRRIHPITHPFQFHATSTKVLN